MADVELSTLGGVIETAYEAQPDTNKFTDAEKTKLANAFVKTTDDTDDITEGSGKLFFTTARVYAALTGAISNILTANLTASRALASDGSGKVVVSTVTAAEQGYLSGVTSAIQTQLNTKISNITGLITEGSNVNITGSGTSGDPYVINASGGGGGGSVDSVNGIFPDSSGNVEIDADDIDDTSTTNKFVTSADLTKLGNLSGTNTGDQTITLSGDATGSGTSGITVTLATVNSNTGNFGSSTAIPSFTVNGKGLITTASTNVVIAPAGTLTGTTLASNVVTSSLTSVGTIGTGVWQGTAIADAYISSAATWNAKQEAITGAATTITTSNLTVSRAVISNASGKIAVSSVTDTELGYLSGVSSSIQTQFSGKQATITGAATTITSSDLTASRAVISNASGKVAVSAVTDTELGYVGGVTSAIQTQLDAKTPLTPRVQAVTSSATVTPTSTNDIVTITAQAAGLTLANPTGTAVEGQAMVIRIKDDGTARTINFDTAYRAIGVELPTTTVISKTLYLGMIWNNTDSKWDVTGLSQEA